MQKMKTCWFLLSIALSCCEAYKILVVFPMPGRSHGILGEGLVRNLLKAGHEVTYITTFGYKNPPANLRQIEVSGNRNLWPLNFLNLTTIMSPARIKVEDHMRILSIMQNNVKVTLEKEEVQKLLNDPKEHFDVAIVKWCYSDLPSGFATIFDCPLIWVSTVEVSWMILNLVEQPTNPAYTADSFSPYSPPLNFRERVGELWIQLKVQFQKFMYADSLQIQEYDRLIAPIVLKRGRQPPSVDDVRYNASLILGNSHVSTGDATSLPQSYKPIGGYHIEPNVKLLSESLKKILDNAKNGVIYFSMGSNLKSKDLPDELKRNILKMFGSLKQIVIWKFEEVLPNLPPNVHILEWAPQQSILSHPNCILFITHGGLLSTTEAIHFGVPIVGIPVFADQFINIVRAVKKGFAKRVDLSHKMVKSLKAAIHEMITNPRYAEKVKELSFIYHDRPMKPGAELVHWVQHVVRTRGAPHLRSSALHMPFYQKIFLDLVAIVVVLLVGIVILLKGVYTMISKKKKFGGQKKYN